MYSDVSYVEVSKFSDELLLGLGLLDKPALKSKGTDAAEANKKVSAPIFLAGKFKVLVIAPVAIVFFKLLDGEASITSNEILILSP